MTAGAAALEALRARFSPADIAQQGALPYREVLYRARERRARSLEANGLEETPESARETPVIRALHTFIVEQEPPVALVPWDGSLG